MGDTLVKKFKHRGARRVLIRCCEHQRIVVQHAAAVLPRFRVNAASNGVSPVSLSAPQVLCPAVSSMTRGNKCLEMSFPDGRVMMSKSYILLSGKGEFVFPCRARTRYSTRWSAFGAELFLRRSISFLVLRRAQHRALRLLCSRGSSACLMFLSIISSRKTPRADALLLRCRSRLCRAAFQVNSCCSLSTDAA